MTLARAQVAPARVRRTEAPWPGARRLPPALAGLTVLAQVAYPLVHGQLRDRLTVATVLLFAGASLTHAAVWRGPQWATALGLASAGVGFVVEAVGTRTGLPFGSYTYAGSLGPRLLSVPVVIPLAWTMMSYPALLAGRRLTRGRWTGPLVAGVALASWDLFLDPQMVAAGHWSWTQAGPALPGAAGVPVSNYLGWLAVSVGLMAVLWRLPHPETPTGMAVDDRVPYALYLWTYASSVLANAAFFHRPGVAVLGGLGMGAVAIPLARSLWRSPRASGS